MNNTSPKGDSLKSVNHLTNFMEGGLNTGMLYDIKEKNSKSDKNNYSATAYVTIHGLYTGLNLHLDIGKNFHGMGLGLKSVSHIKFTGTLSTNDLDKLTTKGTLYNITDTEKGIIIVFYDTVVWKPLGSFFGTGGPMIGVTSGHGSWS
ncbi:VapA/VapB family virulence-associated protein [Xenorhabdus sp. 12]|uniref:VapA/VapB family virulence-associated protein n=1 Tax=Xenorhabdus santafensis TaxID=2582833 RepID=A0ABU4S9K4_9GAMM|nr:VapA/VapB family virulence-associated protein [Xenorhabdus sp. 12]MDX7987435.1 VapA/VapB family virulence-associated protein [Xenorhabdus sp. 12]